MASNDQIKAYIQKLVKEEVAKIAPQLIRETLTRGLGHLIVEAADAMTDRESTMRGNSKKRVALTESYDAEEYPTVTGRAFDSTRMAELTGYGDLKKVGQSTTGITIDHAITEAGNPVPIRPDQIPESVQTALNKDYRPLIAAWNKKNG